MAATGLPVELVGHSQGTLLLNQAIALMGPGTRFAPGSHVSYNKGIVNPASAYGVSWERGLTVSYKPNGLDIVSALGSWWLFPTAVAALPYFIASGAHPHVKNAF